MCKRAFCWSEAISLLMSQPELPRMIQHHTHTLQQNIYCQPRNCQASCCNYWRWLFLNSHCPEQFGLPSFPWSLTRYVWQYNGNSVYLIRRGGGVVSKQVKTDKATWRFMISGFAPKWCNLGFSDAIWQSSQH